MHEEDAQSSKEKGARAVSNPWNKVLRADLVWKASDIENELGLGIISFDLVMEFQVQLEKLPTWSEKDVLQA